MLGSLTLYRRILHENVFTNPSSLSVSSSSVLLAGEQQAPRPLPAVGHAIAGSMAGATVSFIAAPVEHIKARLQIQYAAEKTNRLYSGPIDCTRKIVNFRPAANHQVLQTKTRKSSTAPTVFPASTMA